MTRSDMESFDEETVTLHGKVKWFNESKGFGFLVPEDGSPDAFLHITVLEQAGLRTVPDGTGIKCEVARQTKGQKVTSILSIDLPEGQPDSAAANASGPRELEGTVKFFRSDKGFGFIKPDDGSQDIFVHARAMEQAGIVELEPEQRVRLTVKQGQKGPLADTIELI